MRDSSLERYAQLTDVPTPSAYVTLAWAHRGAAVLPGLRAFKNLTELDLSGNHLTVPITDLGHLRFLRKLILSHNLLTAVDSLPLSLEHLTLSHNFLTSIASLKTLQHLHTLDAAHNQLSALDFSVAMPALKCVYASHNAVESLRDIEQLPSLVEFDLAYNPVRSSADLELVSKSPIAVVRLTNVSELLTALSLDYQPWDFFLVEDGIYLRNAHKLKSLKSSRYLKLIKTKQKSSPKLMSSPEWGHARTSSGVFLEAWDEPSRVSSDPISLESQRLSLNIHKFEPQRTSLRPPLGELQGESLDHSPIFSSKLEETFQHTEDESLYSLFQDLIVYLHLDQGEEDFSFSVEKYERVAAVIKERERERLTLIDTCASLRAQIADLEQSLYSQERVLMRMNDAESRLARKSVEEVAIHKLKKENATLTQRLETTGRIKDTLEGLQDANAKLIALLEAERSKNEDVAGKLSNLSSISQQYWEEAESLKTENEALRGELREGAKGWLVTDRQEKIRELEEVNETLKGGRGDFSLDSSEMAHERFTMNSVVQADCSYYRRTESGSVLINKRVGLYVEQLKSKIQRLKHKVQVLRDQRNNSSAQLQALAKAVSSLQTKV